MKYLNAVAAATNFFAAGVCLITGSYLLVGVNVLFGLFNLALLVGE